MASTKFTRRDLNRFKKVYPFVQRKPRFALMSDKEANIEVAEIIFDNEEMKVYEFSTIYSAAPVVTISGFDSMSSTNGNANVALMVSEITSQQVKIVSSEKFRGSVFIQVISVGS